MCHSKATCVIGASLVHVPMVKILDRYLVREIAVPFVISLVVLTFVLMIPPIVLRAQELIATGVEVRVVAHAVMLLRPVAFVALLGTAATAYAIIVALPGSNQAFRTIVANMMEERIESTLTPRV